MLFSILLYAHSWLRWVVVILGLIASVYAFRGWFTHQEWIERDRRLQLAFVGVLDTQFLLGCFLYIVSPLTPGSLKAIGGAMHDPILRFFSVEHSAAMFVAVMTIHVVSALSRRAPEGFRRHKRWALGLFFGLLVMASGIPWPGLQHGRPLFHI